MRIRSTLIAVLACLWCASTATADTLSVTNVHYKASSGAFLATVTATAPQGATVALALYRNHCPAAPGEADFAPEGIADGEPLVRLANPPGPAQFGRFALCVWIVEANQAVGDRFEETVHIANPRHRRARPRRDPIPAGKNTSSRPTDPCKEK